MDRREIDWTVVGAKIKRLRQQRGLTQRQLVEPLASSSFLSLIESGRRQPSAEVLDHISAALGVEPDELLTGRSRRAEVQLELALQDARELLRRGELDRARDVGSNVVLDAEKLGFVRLQGKSYELLASIDERRNLTDSALAIYRKAEAVWRDEPAHLRFQTVAGIGRCLQALGDARYAIHMLESYLLELERRELPDPIATMRTHSALIIAYSAIGLTARAAEAADKAEALAPRVSDTEQLACMYMNVTHSLFAQGRLDDAADAIRRAEAAYASLGWEIDAAGAKLNRGVVQIEKGDWENARENLTGAVATYKEAGHTADGGRALNELAKLERLMGNVAEAEELLREAQSSLAGADFAERGLNLRELGLCAKDRDVQGARAHFRRAIDLYALAGATRDVATTYRLLGDSYMDAGDVRDAAEAYRAGIEAVEANPE